MAQSVGRRRLSADRCLRIWSIMEHIASRPGLNRRELTAQFALSERQLQADLNVIRDEVGLPLIRAQGYRFAGASPTEHALSLADLVALAPVLQRALAEQGPGREPLLSLAAKLPSLFTPPLQQLVRAALRIPKEIDVGLGPEAFVLLAEALLRAQPVRLRYLTGSGPHFRGDPIVEPQVLMSFEGSWYIIGQCRQLGRVAIFCLDAVETVTPPDGAP